MLRSRRSARTETSRRPRSSSRTVRRCDVGPLELTGCRREGDHSRVSTPMTVPCADRDARGPAPAAIHVDDDLAIDDLADRYARDQSGRPRPPGPCPPSRPGTRSGLVVGRTWASTSRRSSPARHGVQQQVGEAEVGQHPPVGSRRSRWPCPTAVELGVLPGELDRVAIGRESGRRARSAPQRRAERQQAGEVVDGVVERGNGGQDVGAGGQLGPLLGLAGSPPPRSWGSSPPPRQHPRGAAASAADRAGGHRLGQGSGLIAEPGPHPSPPGRRTSPAAPCSRHRAERESPPVQGVDEEPGLTSGGGLERGHDAERGARVGQ